MYVCSKCGTEYPNDVMDTWGATAQSSGLGPRPICAEVVPVMVGAVESQAVCRGELMFSRNQS